MRVVWGEVFDMRRAVFVISYHEKACYALGYIEHEMCWPASVVLCDFRTWIRNIVYCSKGLGMRLWCPVMVPSAGWFGTVLRVGDDVVFIRRVHDGKLPEG